MRFFRVSSKLDHRALDRDGYNLQRADLVVFCDIFRRIQYKAPLVFLFAARNRKLFDKYTVLKVKTLASSSSIQCTMDYRLSQHGRQQRSEVYFQEERTRYYEDHEVDAVSSLRHVQVHIRTSRQSLHRDVTRDLSHSDNLLSSCELGKGYSYYHGTMLRQSAHGRVSVDIAWSASEDYTRCRSSQLDQRNRAPSQYPAATQREYHIYNASPKQRTYLNSPLNDDMDDLLRQMEGLGQTKRDRRVSFRYEGKSLFSTTS